MLHRRLERHALAVGGGQQRHVAEIPVPLPSPGTESGQVGMRGRGHHQGRGAQVRLEQRRLAHGPDALGPAQLFQEGLELGIVELPRPLQPLACE
ncbi:hypothetical protein FFK22_041065 [Mycobacterium sp. KBS0706]|uniref:hypothetical protein n=1 Tax=Mycobacterium sp. KBS0706 TaxID=2578109 RepID=UPI00110F95FB|nr:hypothetical protein [Mycobacterium sp. KBS0706]TSD82827.1 hypothetical protein FFK22_041065 [Mycobacterium sp. KBS0706]